MILCNCMCRLYSSMITFLSRWHISETHGGGGFHIADIHPLGGVDVHFGGCDLWLTF